MRKSLPLIVALLLLPTPARAGDFPLLMLSDNWGVGKIDGRIMFYAGKDRYLDTPIPAFTQNQFLACLALAVTLTAVTHIVQHVRRKNR
jgi:hypothetical protein